MYYLHRTLLKELIRERARRGLDKNSFESNRHHRIINDKSYDSTAEHFLMFFPTRGTVFRLVLVGKLLVLTLSNISDLLSTIFLPDLNRIMGIMD